MTKDIIEIISNKQIAIIKEAKENLKKDADSSIIYFQNNNFSSDSIYNLITSLITIHSRVAKLEGKQEIIEYFGFMKNANFEE